MKRRGNAKALIIIAALLSAALLHACGAAGDDRKLQQLLSGTTTPTATVVGMKTCTQCHYSSASAWLQTKHANLDPNDPGNLSYTGSPSFATAGWTVVACGGCHDLDIDSTSLISSVTGNAARPVVGCEACHGGGSNHNGAGPIGPSRLAATALGGVTPVSGWTRTCNGCHELLDTTTGLIATSTHSAAQPPLGNDYLITDTHFASNLAIDWSSSSGSPANTAPSAKSVRGYAMNYADETTCTNCHRAHGNTTIAREWQKSAHADTYAMNTSDPSEYFSGAWSYYNWSCDGTNTSGCGASSGRTSNRKVCQRCHTTTAFKAYADALRTGNSSQAESIRSGTAALVAYNAAFNPEMLKCEGCHTDNRGSLRNPGPVTGDYDLFIRYPTSADPENTYSRASYTYPDVSASNICMACHTGRESGETIKNLNASGMPAIDLNNASFINSHYLTGGGTVFTATGYEFPGRDYNNPTSFRHSRIGSASEPNTGTQGPCVGCHMSRPGGSGDHLFLPIGRFNNIRYNAGTVAVTNGNATVTGTGTTWTTAGIVTATDEFLGPDGRSYAITTVVSNTSITLAEIYRGTTVGAPGKNYAIIKQGGGTTGIASEACFVCHIIPNNMLTDSTNERKEQFHAALMALQRELDKRGFFFTPANPYFFNPRTTFGTVTLTPGSKAVTGIGTLWNSAGIAPTTETATSTTPGDRFRAYDGTFYIIDTVTGDTALTLKTPFNGATVPVTTNYAIVRTNSSTTTTGTVTVTFGSPTVTGSGTNWTASTGITTGVTGTPFRDSNGVYYQITGVDLVAQTLTISPNYAGADGAGQSYTIVKNKHYTTGTVTVTPGSAIVTGVGTNWTTAGIVTGINGDPFRDSNGVYFTIQSVDSDTLLTLATNYAGAGAGTYGIVRYGTANAIRDWDPKDEGGTNGGTWAKHNMGAAFNFNLLEHDPGAYVHNSTYTRRLIYDAIDWVDDHNMNYSVGTTLNNLTTEVYKDGAINYLGSERP